MPRSNDLEHRALEMIVNQGEEGMLQCQMWRKLGATSREGSRIAIKLKKKGFIKRERELYDQRWTYRLYPTRRPVSIKSIVDCPCLMCPDSSQCGASSTISPHSCEKLTEWVLDLAHRKMNPSGES